MKTSLAVRLLMDEYWKCEDILDEVENTTNAISFTSSRYRYLIFLRSQANSNKSCTDYAYTLAVREIEKA